MPRIFGRAYGPAVSDSIGALALNSRHPHKWPAYLQLQQGVVFVGAMLASPSGRASPAPTNCARGSSDDIDQGIALDRIYQVVAQRKSGDHSGQLLSDDNESKTGSLKAHRYGMVV